MTSTAAVTVKTVAILNNLRALWDQIGPSVPRQKLFTYIDLYANFTQDFQGQGDLAKQDVILEQHP